MQASMQDTQVIFQKALTAFRQAMAPPTTPVQPVPAAPPQTQVPLQPEVQVVLEAAIFHHQPSLDAEEMDELAHLAPGVNHEQDMKFLTMFTKQKPLYYEGNPIGIVAEE